MPLPPTIPIPPPNLDEDAASASQDAPPGIAELLAMPGIEDIEIEILPRSDFPRPVDLS